MSMLPNSGLEDHPTGTGNLNPIVNNNWNAGEAWFNPAYGMTCSQTLTTVTSNKAVFNAGDAISAGNGKSIIRFADGSEVNVTAYISPTQVSVDVSQTKTSQAFILYYPGTTHFDAIPRALTKQAFGGLQDAQMLQWDATNKRFKAVTKPGRGIVVGQVLFGGGAGGTPADLNSSSDLVWDNVLKVFTINGRAVFADTVVQTVKTINATTNATQIDGKDSNNFFITLNISGGSTTAITMVNIQPGAKYRIVIKQGVGSQTVTWDSAFKFPNANPTINATINSFSFADVLGLTDGVSTILVGG